MRVSRTTPNHTPEYPRLVCYKGMADPLVVLATDANTGIVLLKGSSLRSIGEEIDMSSSAWEPFDGAVTLQN